MPQPSGRLFRRLWRTMPDRVPIVFQTQTAPGVYTSGNVTDCWWRPGGSGEAAPSQGVYTRSLRTWFIPKEKRITSPNVGDLIVGNYTDGPFVDPLTTWTVLSISDVGALGAWSCDSISLQLQADLRDSGTISRPTNAQDAQGRMSLLTYTPVASGVPCKVQPMDSLAGDVFDRRTIPNQLAGYLGYFLDVRAKDVLSVNGANYTIKATTQPERIDVLQTLELELIL